MLICISLDLYFEMGPPMSKNQVKESQSRVASHHPLRWGIGRYRCQDKNLDMNCEKCHFMVTEGIVLGQNFCTWARS